jgi:ribonuclease HI
VTNEGKGYGYVVYEGQEEVATGYASTHPVSVVFDADALGALRRMQQAVKDHPGEPITTCADNTSALWCSQKDASDTSQGVFKQIHQLMDKHDMTLRWIPGHTNIKGNERADELAKIGIIASRDPESLPTAAGMKARAARETRDMASKWWLGEETSRPSGFEEAQIVCNPRTCPAALKLPRRILGWHLATISAHGDYKWYHDRYHHMDAEVHCPCGYAKGPEHMVRCPLVEESMAKWPVPAKPPRRPDGKYWYDDRVMEKLDDRDFNTYTLTPTS